MTGFTPRSVLTASLLFFLFLTLSPYPRFTDDAARKPPGTEDNTRFADYLWPTDATRIVTSTFGEFRKTHFHAGIDISTNNSTGYKVFASRDGYVWRVGISPGGYGKVLFIRHDDGFVTAYAHLKGFSDAVNEAVRREQLRLERFPVDMFFEPGDIPVRRGEIVAYSGRSGTGPAHLHFEIRDENLNPVNPLVFDNIAIPDSRPPEIRSIVVAPLDPLSSVSGRQRPVIVRNFRREGTAYVLRDLIRVRGRAGIGINVRDRVDGTYHPVGVHRLQLYVDDTLRFAARLDRVREEEMKQILLFYDLTLMRKRVGKYQKLYVEEGTSLPIFERFAHGAGILDADSMSEGEHTFRVLSMDIVGNATEVRGILLTEPERRKERAALTPAAGVPREAAEEIFTLPADREGWFSFDRGSLEVVFDSGAVFKPVNIRIVKTKAGGGVSYRIEPRDVLLNRGVRVFLHPGGGNSGTTGVYWRGAGGWELLPTTFNSATGYFSARLVMTLGEIALFDDSTPPRIGGLNIRRRRAETSVHFSVSDSRSGIDAEQIKMYIDDKFVIPEIDERGWRVSYSGPGPEGKGVHTVRIEVRDLAGNRTTLTRTFIVG